MSMLLTTENFLVTHTPSCTSPFSVYGESGKEENYSSPTVCEEVVLDESIYGLNAGINSRYPLSFQS